MSNQKSIRSMNSRQLITGLICLIILAGCSQSETLFEEIPGNELGVDFRNDVTPTEEMNILDYLYFYNGAGVAVGDINGDDLPDIYLVANQQSNKLFLNKGNLHFEDITEKAQVSGKADWSTGVTMADVNGDGLLDIYMVVVSGLNGLHGTNELFINNGDLTFTESARKYGLDQQSSGTHSAFFDMDNDGDLDMYLLNHAVHTTTSYGAANTRIKRVEDGDKLFRNDGNYFNDISEKAGIYGGANGYGLGIATADFNQDGYTDIYVSNDFHEDDYYYLNNGDGTFTESVKTYFDQVSRFSMGSDAADINNDGFPDLITLDMLPEDEIVLKSSMSDDNLKLQKLKTNRLGYHHQFARNMLQINQRGLGFTESALLNGVAATDWSWSPLFADFDMDGYQDLFVSNGIAKRPNDLDYINFISNEQIKKKLNASTQVDQEVMEHMPSGKVTNYMFRGGSHGFENTSSDWGIQTPTISNGSAYADFDNDGDLDLITNIFNGYPTIYKNHTDQETSSIKVKLTYQGKNLIGIGAKVYVYSGEKIQYRQLFTTKGFQSSSEPIIHFGLNPEIVDSLVVIWPDQTRQPLFPGELSHQINISYQPKGKHHVKNNLKASLFKKSEIPGFNYQHQENDYNDFDRQSLMPYRISDRGPAVAVGDINGDGAEDIFFGGSKHHPSEIWVQTASGFEKKMVENISNDAIQEHVSAIISDFNGDQRNDILAVSAGGEFRGKSEQLLDKLYSQTGDDFVKQLLPEIFENSAVVKAADYDQDGDLDVFVGGGPSSDFGRVPVSFILENTGGDFKVSDAGELLLGMVTDATWTDFDGDQDLDLIVVGEWMSPQFLENRNQQFVNVTKSWLPDELNGLWQAIEPFDMDNDGDLDYLLGNWGLNTKFTASSEFPLLMYVNDFDQNGKAETLVACAKDGEYYEINGFDKLTKQLKTLIRKKYNNYASFAGETIDEIFDGAALSSGKKFQVHQLSSGYLKNENGILHFESFEAPLQVSPITEFLSYDFDRDQQPEVFVAGNYFGLPPYLGRLGSLSGGVLDSDGTFRHGTSLGIDLSGKSVRGLDIIKVNGKDHLLVTVNNGPAELYKF